MQWIVLLLDDFANFKLCAWKVGVFHQFDVVLGVFMCAGKERILANLVKHPIPHPAPELQQEKAPVAEVPTACLTDSKAAAELIQQDLSILQDQARYIELIKTVAHSAHIQVETLKR